MSYTILLQQNSISDRKLELTSIICPNNTKQLFNGKCGIISKQLTHEKEKETIELQNG